MTNDNAETAFPNREFIALVRAELEATGRSDVSIQRSWIVEDDPNYRFLLNVPVGSELAVPLKVKDGFFHTNCEDDRRHHAREFAKALVNLKSAEGMLIKYVRDIRREANAVIAAARADGLEVSLEKVGLKPTYAYHLNWDTWKEAAMHVLAEVTVRHTTFFLRPGTSEVWIEEPEHVAREMADILQEQRERQDRLAELDAQGADLVVDGLTLDLLAVHGLDAAETLRTVWRNQHASFEVEWLGRKSTLSLVSGDGQVTASLSMPEAYWNGEHLWFMNDEAEKDHKELIGRSLGDLVPHPAFTSRPVVSVMVRHIDHISFDLSDKAFFDADTGRIWREERLAA